METRDSFERLWLRFGSATDPRRGVAAAFALVACYDGSVSATEVRRFAEFVRDLPPTSADNSSESVSMEVRESAFDEPSRAVLDDFDNGRDSILSVLKRFRGDSAATEVILRAAQVAVVADGQDEVREEVGLREVCEALGVDPQQY